MKIERVGWIPVCVKEADGDKAPLGPWPQWIETSRKKLLREIKTSAVGFEFVIVPCFIEDRSSRPPRRRRSGK
jgi:hypothetical protein